MHTIDGAIIGILGRIIAGEIPNDRINMVNIVPGTGVITEITEFMERTPWRNFTVVHCDDGLDKLMFNSSIYQENRVFIFYDFNRMTEELQDQIIEIIEEREKLCIPKENIFITISYI